MNFRIFADIFLVALFPFAYMDRDALGDDGPGSVGKTLSSVGVNSSGVEKGLDGARSHGGDLWVVSELVIGGAAPMDAKTAFW